MSTLTSTPVQQETAKPRRLRGLAWLMVRQHRSALLACAAATVLGAAWIVYQRWAMLDTLHSAGWPGKPTDVLNDAMLQHISRTFNDAAGYLSCLPLLFGVFLGAPLISSDQEHGTAQLVTTQSVPRLRWLLWKLVFALVLVVVTTGILGALFTWWWRAAVPVVSSNWLDGSIFDTTGPVLTTLTLFTTSLGIVIGTLIRRAVTAMALTFFGSVAFLGVVDYLTPHLGTPRRIAFPLDSEHPAGLTNAVQVDQWVGTASDKLYGWSTCVSDDAPEACRARLGIVNSVWDYFGYDQMSTLQWTTAGLLLAGSAALVALVWWRTRRHPL
ncbi:ABC transporter permease subunit [Streptomyces sp. NPDC050485]|uniref:ABC transporter permease subunit n=1 Tax=Streptomyces sp. NPDC050485 TaxID=3365617 RepID=UPI0037B03729